MQDAEESDESKEGRGSTDQGVMAGGNLGGGGGGAGGRFLYVPFPFHCLLLRYSLYDVIFFTTKYKSLYFGISV